MGDIKGISYGVYLDRRIKPSRVSLHKGLKPREVCEKCKNKSICKYGNVSKFENEKIFSNNIECEEMYFTISRKASLTISRDKTTGKERKQSFTGNTKEEAISRALAAKIELEKNGGVRTITKINKTMVDLISNVIDERFNLGNIKPNTCRRKRKTLKKLQNEKIANIPIVKVKRDDIVKYLETLKPYSESTIKQIYELICMAFGQATYEHIINDNFMTGWKRVEKPKSEYKSHKRKALTIDEQKKLVNYLNLVDYKDCRHKYLLLLLLSTGMRIGEALVLDYEKDIDLQNGEIHIRRTQTKDLNGKAIIGETAKTSNGQRTLNMNNISKQIIKNILDHKIENKNHLLFCKDDKTIYTENSINSALKRIALKLDIGIYEEENKQGKLLKKTDVHTHMLRGTFATRCAEAKIAPAVLKKILGHSDITVTMQYYVDVDAEFEKSENKNVEDYLKDKDIFGIDFTQET